MTAHRTGAARRAASAQRTAAPRRAASALAFVAALVLASVAAVSGATVADASSQSLPLVVEVDGLTDDATAERSWPVTVERDAVLAEVSMVAQSPGDLVWNVELRERATDRTVPVANGQTGAALPAGAYDVRVDVHVISAEPGTSGTLVGSIVLAPDAASTGAPATAAAGPAAGLGPTFDLVRTAVTPRAFALGAAAVVALGAVLAAAARSHRAQAPRHRDA